MRALIDLSQLDMLSARDMLFRMVCHAAASANMKVEVECSLLSPAEDEAHGLAGLWRVMWESGPFHWGSKLSGGDIFDFEADEEWRGLDLPLITMGEPTEWYLEPHWSFDVGFVPNTFYASLSRTALITPKSGMVVATGFVADELMRELNAHPELLRTIERRQFERVVAELFHGFGYEVELTARTRDGGKDIVAVKSVDEVNLRYLVECKRPDPGNKIEVSTVRELLGVLSDDPASKALLVTTTAFTRGALELFDRHKWQLEGKEYGDVVTWLREYGRVKGDL